MAEPEKKDEKKEEIKVDMSKDTYSKDEVLNIINSKIKEVVTTKDSELKTIIETEKKKLYDTIDAEKKKSSEFEKKLRETEKAEEEKKRLEEEEKKAEMTAIQRLETLEKTIEEKDKRFQEIVSLKDEEYKGELHKRDLAIYKEKLVAGYNGAIIPEMVSGKTEEELNLSAEQAAERYKQIAERSKQEAMDEVVKSGKFPKPGDVDNSLKKSSGVKDLMDVLSMPNDEYEAYKKTVFDGLK